MGDVIRLKPYAKAKARAARDAEAAANRVRYGRPKPDRQAAAAARRKAAAELDGKRLESPAGGDRDEG